jgi:thiamine biosynthesis lipoprotein
VELFTLRDATLSTSGNTPSYSGHIVNPLTGEPIEQRMMAAVVAKDALEAEVMSTAMMVATDEQMQRIVAERDDIRVKRYNL